MQLAFGAFLSFLKEYGGGLNKWMKFFIINIVLVGAMIFFFDINVNKAITDIFHTGPVEMYIEPERVAEVEKILQSVSYNTGADGSYIFAYMPMYAIKSSTLLQYWEIKGVNYLSYENFTNVPITIDGQWFLRMRAGEMYSVEVLEEGVYNRMYERGVRYFYAYPITGKEGILYGNLMIAFDKRPDLEERYLRDYLKIASESIVSLLKL